MRLLRLDPHMGNTLGQIPFECGSSRPKLANNSRLWDSCPVITDGLGNRSCNWLGARAARAAHDSAGSKYRPT